MQNLIERVDNWIEDVLSECDSTYTAEQKQKRRRDSMDDQRTPRPSKKTKIYPTPDISERRDGSQIVQLPMIPPPPSSTTSTNTTRSTRSQSPRKRAFESLRQKPEYRKVAIQDLNQWEMKHERIVKSELFVSLRKCFTGKSPSFDEFFEKDLDRIFEDLRAIPIGADEDYWSDRVVVPCLRLAERLTGRRQVTTLPVKTVGISDTTLLETSEEKPNIRRVDYCFAVSPVASSLDSERDIMRDTEGSLCQSIHPQVYNKILFSHLELKVSSDNIEAHTQLKIWTSAGFEKQRRLRRSRFGDLSQTLLAPQPVWVWLTDKVEVFIVVPDWDNDFIWFLPQRNFALDVFDKESLRKLVTAMYHVLHWGATSYLEWFRTELLGEKALTEEVDPSSIRESDFDAAGTELSTSSATRT